MCELQENYQYPFTTGDASMINVFTVYNYMLVAKGLIKLTNDSHEDAR